MNNFDNSILAALFSGDLPEGAKLLYLVAYYLHLDVKNLAVYTQPVQHYFYSNLYGRAPRGPRGVKKSDLPDRTLKKQESKKHLCLELLQRKVPFFLGFNPGKITACPTVFSKISACTNMN
jgi:hypothetical protein